MRRTLIWTLLAAVVVSAILVPYPAMAQDKLGFGDKVSIQVTRGNQTSAQSGNQTSSGTTKPSGCLIATAAFGSELTPQVQFLRGFRDNHIMSTTAGSSFMNVFNTWYYSFSPSVADYERQQPWLQATVKTAIYPLLGILNVAEKGYGLSAGEGGAVIAGFSASALIGAVYLAPAAVAVRKKAADRRLAIGFGIAVVASLSMIAAGVVANSSALLMFSTALFVISSIGVGLLAVVALARMIEEKRLLRR
jgi:peptide/nickel transport system substrate-binding protein